MRRAGWFGSSVQRFDSCDLSEIPTLSLQKTEGQGRDTQIQEGAGVVARTYTLGRRPGPRAR